PLCEGVLTPLARAEVPLILASVPAARTSMRARRSGAFCIVIAGCAGGARFESPVGGCVAVGAAFVAGAGLGDDVAGDIASNAIFDGSTCSRGPPRTTRVSSGPWR